ncbi:MAG: hypothetical protein AB7S77_19495 [Desulfatirhabdiaceae bacterium]
MPDMTREEMLAAGKNCRTVHARSLLWYWTIEVLGIIMTGLSIRLDISVNAVSKPVARGRTLAKMHHLSSIETNVQMVRAYQVCRSGYLQTAPATGCRIFHAFPMTENPA